MPDQLNGTIEPATSPASQPAPPRPVYPPANSSSPPPAPSALPHQPLATPIPTPPSTIPTQPSMPEQHEPIGQPAPSGPAYERPVEIASWTSPTRLYDPKSAAWFIGLFAIALVAVIVLAVLKEFWLILVVAASVFVLYALAKVEPEVVTHRILNTGIETAGRLYPWKDLQSYWLADNGNLPLLRVDTKLLFPHNLELLLPEGTDTEELGDLLIQYLPEIEKPASQAGSMADQAILSVFQVVPFRDRLVNWWQKRF